MGLFNLFKKKDNKQDQVQTDPLPLQGPKYLRNHLTPLTIGLSALSSFGQSEKKLDD